MIIGVSGVAGVGKDLFVQSCVEELKRRGKKATSIAIATSLKSETSTWCYNHYGINPLDCTREEKEKIREFLVYHGVFKRKLSEGRHWIDLASENINSMEHIYDYLFVSDVRYDDYDKDEVSWIKEELNGMLVHISQYEIKEVTSKKEWPKTSKGKVFRPPANSEEARNDPSLKSKADYNLEWEFKTDINKDKYISSKVVKFIEWMNLKT